MLYLIEFISSTLLKGSEVSTTVPELFEEVTQGNVILSVYTTSKGTNLSTGENLTVTEAYQFCFYFLSEFFSYPFPKYI